MIFEGDLLAERARVTPDALAVVSVESGERLTYAELNERASAAAARIRELTIAPGERYGILSHNSVDYLAFFFAAAKTGSIVVPLSTRATARELDAIIADCGMKMLFHSEEFAHFAKQLAVARAPMEFLPEDVSMRAPRGADEATYCLLYTSGTTGKPKGVMIPKRQLYWNGYNTAIGWGLRPEDVAPVFTPMYHAGGLAVFLIPLFCTGGTIVLHKGFDPSEVWRTVDAERCTVIFGVPTIWKMLMDAPEFATVDLSRVRWCISGGAPLPKYIIDAYQKRGVVFKQGYGMTEAGVNCFTMTVEDSYRKPGSIGKPLLFTQVRLVDDKGGDVPDGEIGEMWIRGPHVANGYWNDEHASREAFGSDGWLRTGDLARRDEDGFFYIAGRRKEMFISGGVNVYPAEIEAELVSHPAVADAAVIAVSDEKWGEAGIAFVVAKGVDARALSDYLAQRLAKYKVPREFVFLDALPRTPYGKVEKKKLLECVPSS